MKNHQILMIKVFDDLLVNKVTHKLKIQQNIQIFYQELHCNTYCLYENARYIVNFVAV